MSDAFKCHQSAELVSVVYANGQGAAVHISRDVGTPLARGLMRLCANVLNEEWVEAQRELDELGEVIR